MTWSNQLKGFERRTAVSLRKQNFSSIRSYQRVSIWSFLTVWCSCLTSSQSHKPISYNKIFYKYSIVLFLCWNSDCYRGSAVFLSSNIFSHFDIYLTEKVIHSPVPFIYMKVHSDKIYSNSLSHLPSSEPTICHM